MLSPAVVHAQEASGQDPTQQDSQADDADAEIDAAGEQIDNECREDLNCVVISGARLLGQVDAAQEPIQTLDEADIAAYGAGSIAELVQQLGPAVNSGGGRGGGPPAILLNGVRISGFRELRNFPPEAIERTEILPEETAVRYGFAPNQRVINFILKKNFTAKTVEIEGGGSFRGGSGKGEIEASALNISGSTRISLAAEAESQSRLTEAERDLDLDTAAQGRLATDPDPSEFRTLIPESDEISLNGTVAVPIGEAGKDGALTVNGTLTRNSSRSLSGLESVTLTDSLGNTQVRTLDDPLERQSRTATAQLGASYAGAIDDWQLSVTADGTHAHSISRIDRRRDLSLLQSQALAGTLALDADLPALPYAGFDFSDSTTNRFDSDATLTGRPLLLPGGDLLVTLNTGATFNSIRSSDTRSGTGETFLDRSRYAGKVTLGVPITSVNEDFGAFLGDLTLDLTGGVDDVSDFGTLYGWSGSLNWRPLDRVGFTATYQYAEAAPSLSQLGAPITESFNVPVFDFTRGETALVTTISGGNPNLLRETQRDWKFAFNYELPFVENGRFQVEYFTNRSADVAASLPTITPEIEAAFPDRIERDAAGQLTRIDYRPITFDQRKSRSLRFSLNLSGPFGAAYAEGEGPQAQGAGGGGGRRAGGGGGEGGSSARMTPERMQELRDQLCSDDPDKFYANLKALANSENPPFPAQMITQLKGADGELDPQKVEFVRRQFCRAGDGAGEQGGASAPDRERLMALRKELCALEPAEFLQRLRDEVVRTENAGGDDVAADEGDRPLLPPFLLERLKDENGEIDAERAEQLRQRICAAGPGSEGGQQAEGGQGSQQRARGGGRRRGGGGFGGGDGRGRFFANADATLRLQDEISISPVGPVLDLLDGDSLGGGGSPEFEVRAYGGIFYRGFGSFFSANYGGPSRIDGAGLPGSTDLFYGDLFTLNARLFVDFDQRQGIVDAVPFLEGSRVSISVANIFDTRRTVVDQNGDVPDAFNPDLIDPYGRSFQISFRKAF
ncbi:TonB-dependent receptor plug domain-containing protein [Pseudoblastomonas halimionae]|uniref:TonB-dependent receptor plug domain-containing protein n=1 Tax=Alteriqipengyuania halimionae TaxID=1926630 RepID=A0A6I4U4M7_9SPHN|nr:TonB-dependent receptor plug domain-containing protein [Alteriqipengyuania halimionae]MXP09875.1 TonB-dependent receptor plug domain-containing protein [Alteriqipengyuania halimionae]